jgi:hypothetical protein
MTLSDDAPTPTSNPIVTKLGRRMNDKQELTFPIAISKTAVWLLGSMLAGNAMLLGWLCLQQMEQGKVLVRMDERSHTTKEQMQIFHSELERLTMTDTKIMNDLQRLQLQAAEHGWKEGGRR